jgi:hypothetical protein
MSPLLIELQLKFVFTVPARTNHHQWRLSRGTQSPSLQSNGTPQTIHASSPPEQTIKSLNGISQSSWTTKNGPTLSPTTSRKRSRLSCSSFIKDSKTSRKFIGTLRSLAASSQRLLLGSTSTSRSAFDRELACGGKATLDLDLGYRMHIDIILIDMALASSFALKQQVDDRQPKLSKRSSRHDYTHSSGSFKRH